jgi:hypothetical protein
MRWQYRNFAESDGPGGSQDKRDAPHPNRLPHEPRAQRHALRASSSSWARGATRRRPHAKAVERVGRQRNTDSLASSTR